MSDKPRKDDELTEDEVERANGEELPPREQMSVIREPMPMVPIEPMPPYEPPA